MEEIHMNLWELNKKQKRNKRRGRKVQNYMDFKEREGIVIEKGKIRW